jgi:hypothetical protein
MKTRHLLLLFVLAGLGKVPGAFGQAAPAAPLTGPGANTSDAKAAPQPPAAPRSRVLSNDVSATISASMPKYNPPPKAPEPKPEEELPDLRDTDKPRNGIIRLPEHIVRERKPPVLRERDVSTKSGLAALAVGRYITDVDRALNRWNFLGVHSTGVSDSTTGRALTMYEEEERLQNMADLNDAAGLASATDKAAGVYIKREAQKTYMRRGDIGPSERNTGAAK